MALFTNLQPAAGQPIAADTALQFDALDPLIEDVRIFVWVSYEATGTTELIHDGTNFTAQFSSSEKTPTPGGVRYTIRRTSGWPNAPELRVDDCACPPSIGGSGGVLTYSNIGSGAAVGAALTLGELQLRTFTSADDTVDITQSSTEIDLQVRTEPDYDTSITAVSGGGVQTLTVPAGKAAEKFDTGSETEDLVVKFPTITADLDARRVGVYLPVGNPSVEVTFDRDTDDVIIYPDGTLVTATTPSPAVPVGTYSGYRYFVWEAVLDLFGPGVHGWAPAQSPETQTWADVLSRGNATGTNNPTIDNPQQLHFGGTAADNSSTVDLADGETAAYDMPIEETLGATSAASSNTIATLCETAGSADGVALVDVAVLGRMVSSSVTFKYFVFRALLDLGTETIIDTVLLSGDTADYEVVFDSGDLVVNYIANDSSDSSIHRGVARVVAALGAAPS